MPTLGAKKKEKKAIKEETITIHGPVGIAGATKEIYAPNRPEIAPNEAERSIIFLKSLVQNRAAAAGVINIAAINTTPTAVIPVTTAKTVNVVNNNSSFPIGRPKAAA